MVLGIFLALVSVPIVEVAVFIEVGGRIGLWSTLGLIVATAVAGTALLRRQGLATLASARATVDKGAVPVQEVLDGVCLLIAGALLLTPGFVTDVFGAMLLVPVLRRGLQRWALARMAAGGRMNAGAGRRAPDGDVVIDGEFTVEDDDVLPPPRRGGGGSR